MDDKEISEEIERWPLVWVDVGDKAVCIDCIRLNEFTENNPQKFFWFESIGLPGSGNTICQGRCRCLLLPVEILEMYPSFRGQSIKLRGNKNDTEYLTISKEVDYALLSELDSLVYQYEKLTPNLNLPDYYYNIGDPLERLKFLEDVIKKIKDDKIDDVLFDNIKLTNKEVLSREYIRKKIKDK